MQALPGRGCERLLPTIISFITTTIVIVVDDTIVIMTISVVVVIVITIYKGRGGVYD